MKTLFVKSFLFLTLTISLLSLTLPGAIKLPANWFPAGSHPTKYEMGIDPGAASDGNNAATIKSIDAEIDGFGTLMQICQPEKFLGKRVRMSGYIKSKDVKEWSGFWFRVDQKNSQQSLAFDNMQDRAVKGTTDWKKYEIVLDVASNASALAYGALLNGTGQIWFDQLSFEIVDASVPVTTMKMDDAFNLVQPTNLGFEEQSKD